MIIPPYSSIGDILLCNGASFAFSEEWTNLQMSRTDHMHIEGSRPEWYIYISLSWLYNMLEIYTVLVRKPRYIGTQKSDECVPNTTKMILTFPSQLDPTSHSHPCAWHFQTTDLWWWLTPSPIPRLTVKSGSWTERQGCTSYTPLPPIFCQFGEQCPLK